MILDGHAITIVGITPPGFFGETLRSDPPEVWIPMQQEPIFRGKNSLLHTFPAWLRVIGRLKPGATPNALPSRLTSLMRVWLVDESGMPAEWMTGIKAGLSKQNIKVVPAGHRRRRHEGELCRQPAYSARRLPAGAADRVREYRESAAGARNGAAGANGGPAGARAQIADGSSGNR